MGSASNRWPRVVTPDPHADYFGKYTALHEGLEPGEITQGSAQDLGLPPPPEGYLVEVGPMYPGSYRKATREPEMHLYQHPFKPWAMPTIVTDRRGFMYIADQQNTKITKRGMEDIMATRGSESLVRASQGHAGARFMDVRANPFGMETMKKVAISAGAIGVGAAITMLGLAIAVDYVNGMWRTAPATGATAADIERLNAGVSAEARAKDGATPKVPYITGYKRAAAVAIVGIVGATAAQSMSKGEDIAEIIAASVGIGGVAGGILSAYGTYRSTPRASQGVFAPVSQRRAA